MLTKRPRVPHIFPVYHVPGFPAFRPLKDPSGTAVREHWAPLFEKHGLPVVFENHDHNFKRTYPIKDGRIDPDGVIYLGDGAWGDVYRGRGEGALVSGKNDADQPFNLVKLNGLKAVFETINLRDQVIDRFEPRAR